MYGLDAQGRYQPWNCYFQPITNCDLPRIKGIGRPIAIWLHRLSDLTGVKPVVVGASCGECANDFAICKVRSTCIAIICNSINNNCLKSRVSVAPDVPTACGCTTTPVVCVICWPPLA